MRILVKLTLPETESTRKPVSIGPAPSIRDATPAGRGDAALHSIPRNETGRRIVLLTYHFPPMASAASLRLRSFAHHLPDHGWHPIVVTPGEIGFHRRDDALLDSRISTVRIERTGTPVAQPYWSLRHRATRNRESPGSGHRLPRALASFLLRAYETVLPDHALPWHVVAGYRAGRICLEEGCDLILTSSPPHSALVAGWIASRISGTPWVADLRDPPTRLDTSDAGRAGRRLWLTALENSTLVRADRLLSNTERSADALRDRFDLPGDRVEVLPNGYDHEEVAAALERARATRRTDPRFTIVHAGALYQDERSPEPIFQAIARVRQRIEGPGIRLVLAGVRPGPLRKAWMRKIEGLGLRDSVETPGFLPHDRALDLMASADLLLVLQGDRFRLQIPSKLFEYLALRRPVLALCGDGATADLVRTSGDSAVIPSSQVEAIAAYLVHRIGCSTGRRDTPAVPAGVQSRRYWVSRLARILGSLSC